MAASRPPRSVTIEDVLNGRPAALTLFDGHSVLASREALRRAGVDGPRRFGSRSAVVCDERGRPTGHLLEEGAMRLVRSVIPASSFAARRRRLAALFMDGTVDGGTAWLHEPDCHGQSAAAYWRDPADYTEAVRVLARAGVQTATHAIGDAAVTHVLDTLAAVVPAGSQVRHRIEHIETLPCDQVPRFAELGVVASMQPSHATDYTRADHSDNWSRRLGPERAGRAWRCRDILDAGAVLTLGSDWPIAPFDPRVVMAAARLRRPASRPDLAPVGPSQALTGEQALHGYTAAPAVTAGTRGGRVAPGYLADLTAFGADPCRTTAEELPGVAVLLTVVDGMVRFRAD